MSYNFNVKLKRAAGADIQVDTAAKYGYWERKDGSEGGGLWFMDSHVESQKLELYDYDGAYELPTEIVLVLRNAGFIVSDDFL